MFQRQWGNSIFPEGLKLKNLPGTVMSYYTEGDKKTLFPTSTSDSGIVDSISSTDAIGMAIINSFKDSKSIAHKLVDKMCPGCWKYGHCVFHQGCDFYANFLLASDYFKKYPKASTKILEKYKDHQEKKKNTRNQNPSNEKKIRNNRKHPYNTRLTKAKVQMLTDMLTDVLEVDDESSSTSESFTGDANEEEVDAASTDE
jgi:hypothetical protein